MASASWSLLSASATALAWCGASWSRSGEPYASPRIMGRNGRSQFQRSRRRPYQGTPWTSRGRQPSTETGRARGDPGMRASPFGWRAGDFRPIVQDYAQQGAVDFHRTVVADESQFPELVHEDAHAGPRGANHLGQRLLTHFCDDRL